MNTEQELVELVEELTTQYEMQKGIALGKGEGPAPFYFKNYIMRPV